MTKETIVKKIYFIILSIIIIGFTVGVIFELDRKKSTPKELLNKIPSFIENFFNTTASTTVTTRKNLLESEIAKFIVERRSKLYNIKQTLKNIKNEKDEKKRRELCNDIYQMRKSLTQIEKKLNIMGISFSKNQQENRRIGKKASTVCHFIIAKGRIKDKRDKK